MATVTSINTFSILLVCDHQREENLIFEHDKNVLRNILIRERKNLQDIIKANNNKECRKKQKERKLKQGERRKTKIGKINKNERRWRQENGKEKSNEKE